MSRVETLVEQIDMTALFETTNKKYIPFYWDMSRYFIAFGGAGSGKSRWVGQKMLYRMLDETPHRILIVRKVATTLRKSVFQLMVDYIHKYGLSSKFIIRKGDMTIECENGNQMYFMGLDDVEKLKSIEGITSIWIEEASEITQDDFLQLDLRLRGYTQNYQQITLSFNPISEHHWIRKLFFTDDIEETIDEDGCYIGDDVTIVKSTYLDNEYIDDRYKKVLNDLKLKDLRMYNIYALGKWGVLGNLVFNPYNDITRFPTVAQIPDLQITYGVDFGFTNPSTFIKIGYSKLNNALYLDELYYESNTTKPEFITAVKRSNPDMKDIVGYGDSAEPASIKEFTKSGFKMKSAHKDTNMSIDFINRHTVYITSRSKNLKKEWEGYKWKQNKDGETVDEVVKTNDHCIDAVRYGAYTKWGIIVDSKGHVSDKQMSIIKSYGKY